MPEGLRADDGAVYYRDLYDYERSWSAPIGKWVDGCVESESMGTRVGWIAEEVLWQGVIVRADLDWSDVRVYEVEEGVLQAPTVYDPRPLRDGERW